MRSNFLTRPAFVVLDFFFFLPLIFFCSFRYRFVKQSFKFDPLMLLIDITMYLTNYDTKKAFVFLSDWKVNGKMEVRFGIICTVGQ